MTAAPARPVVGVVTTSYPRFAGDMSGTFVADRVAEIERGGQTVDLVTPPAGLELFRGGGEGAPERLDAGGARAWIEAALTQSYLAGAVARRAPAWARVESHWLVPSALAVVAAAPRLPHRATAHSGDVALLEQIRGGNAIARALAAANCDLVFVTEDLRRRFARLCGRPCGRVERLTVDRALFRRGTASERAQLRARFDLERPTVLCTGRLVAIKGLDVLVAAAARTRAPVTVVVLGEGPLRAALERQARAAGVDLRLPGVVARSEVAAYLRATDLYVQPSRSLLSGRTEGLPVALLEALAAGLPAIASATGGLLEMDASIHWVAPDDAHNLARSIDNVLFPEIEAHTGLRTDNPIGCEGADAPNLA